MLFFTGISRFSAELQTAHQSALGSKTAELLAMKKMANEAERVLKSGDLNDFGRMLHEAWQIKRGITDRITNEEIDALYDRARAAGATGGKLLGAGGGGFLLLYVDEAHQPAVRAAL
ncbi:MAG: GHMP kinase, partial [Akkermansia sp.]|nr:GHMP kinase [Akkermansia sp.]